MKIQIETIRRELEEKFPLDLIQTGKEIDFMQMAYIDELMKKTYESIKEKVFSEDFNMFECSTFIAEISDEKERKYFVMLSEIVTEKVLCLFLMHPEHFKKSFSQRNWFKFLYQKYHNEFFDKTSTQYRSRLWYKKLRPEIEFQLGLF